ncbi:hypothetical protein DW322_08900 [Rhodococcus rhodnii]|uniref:Uncharacterized protein n=2 Tax=Rhodococcus rhodnii TaxID=38312 RepID=R7WRE2_9NOCA|nr:hypothetical protein Rrhod_0701 [Rhodococcus rhodnii LMG 5362]TXG90321.1 hypothetical protein DW322_08900 [Rhodococcus rhodnii]
MRWPWSKDVTAARRQAEIAAEVHAHSVKLRIESECERREAKQVATNWRRELERNGWTEMLIEAWGGGGGR